jgi:tetratricopeptide (TPR) repeat protein
MKSKFLDMFDNYFSGELSQQEKIAFEDHLKSDHKMAEAFQEYQDLRKGIDYSIMKSLKEDLKHLEASLPEVELEPDVQHRIDPVPTTNRFRIWKVAAAVVLVSLSVGVIFQLQQPSSPQDLFSQYFAPAENLYVSIKRGDDIEANPLVQAFQAYDAEEYSVAIAGFERILGQEEFKDQHSMVQYFLGSAQLAQGQSEASITTFERYLEISQDNIVQAKWYLAMGYLQENRVEEATSLLKELKQSEAYGKEAGRILKKLD